MHQSHMSYIIDHLKQLERLINDRTYIERLIISGINENINHLLCKLTDLKYLSFSREYDQETNFTSLTNLTYLEFGSCYNKKTDLSMLSNLLVLEFDTDFNQPVNPTGLTELRKLRLSSNYNQFINASKFPKLYILLLGYEYQYKDYASKFLSDYNERIEEFEIDDETLERNYGKRYETFFSLLGRDKN